MKFGLSTCLGLFAVLPLSAEVLSPVQAFINKPQETDAELKFGLEALTSYRSGYVYRGFDLAGESLEFQLAGQVALSNTDTIDAGIYYGTASGSGDFTELAGFVDFSRDIGDFTYSALLNVRDYGSTAIDSEIELESGVDIGGSVSWRYSDSIDFTGEISFDTGAGGFYFEGKVGYYGNLGLDAFWTVDAGVGAVLDYYERNGLHQAFLKIGYTYNINDSVSVSPYGELSLGIDSAASDLLVGGVYFAVSF